ncbi:DUF6234 family protein [Streptomyces purpureus]|uniref:DUF6234 family protein n=1 Tax=Streptomyces purpureus TaxID=1951 RepID=UPI0003604D53|nr:DUF6234 family protein [Streptomyces purpureus]
MNLPVAPPAFDATAGARSRAGRGVDIAAGCGLVFLELIALVLIAGAWFMSGFTLDPQDDVEADPLWVYLGVAGGVGVLAVVAAAFAARAGAMVTVVSQGVMAALIAALVFGGAVLQNHEDNREPPRNACADSPSAPWCNG